MKPHCAFSFEGVFSEAMLGCSNRTSEKVTNMGFKLRFVCFFACVLSEAASSALAVPLAAGVAPLKLRIAVVSDGHSRYFIRLLEESLNLIHQPHHIYYAKDIPARRMWSMMGKGEINLIYGMQSQEKDLSDQLILVRNALTNGLVGQRVLLIRPADATVFAQVRSIDDLKRTKLTAGFGAGWGDVKVWATKNLPVYEHVAPWRTIYAMVAAGNRRVDYLPRSVIEVLGEAAAHPELAVEKYLLVDYRADFSFYLGASVASYRPIIERALREADVTGLKARLIEDEFGDEIRALELNRRIRLRLSPNAD
jgi:hypothetical protein